MKPMLSVPTLATDADDERLAALAKALAHPARLKILLLLARTPGCIGGEIVQAVGLAQSTVSEHLRILKAAGVIEGQIDPPRVCYALAPGALAPLAALISALDAASADPACCVTPDS
jgi:ArsR family transcriptional regulator, arsenate/arsenite/antimonite-responsive transcriptional repressor